MSALLVYEGWVASAQSEDEEAAVLLALSYTQAVADEKGWSSAWLAHGRRLIEAADSAGNDPVGFWAELTSSWAETYRKVGGKTPPNWDKLGAFWEEMRDEEAIAQQAPSGLDYAWEWVVESAQDLRDIGNAAGNLADAAGSGARGLENLTESTMGQGVLLLVAAVAAVVALR